jgi:hypothetical protein
MRIGRLRWLVTLWVLAAVASARAEVLWMPLSYADLISDSDVIVVGKISQVARGVHCEGGFNCSRIAVQEVLKGTPPADGIRLDYPCRNPVVLEGETPPQASPTDVFFEEGQEGIWFLKQSSDSKNTSGGHFLANHPGRFRPVLFVARVRDEIRKAAATAPRNGI